VVLNRLFSLFLTERITVRLDLKITYFVKGHIVVVDDDRDIQELLGMLLIDEGYKVTGFEEFPGMEEIINTRPDLIILDVKMRKFNGIELSRQLKNHPGSKEIPLLGLSASAENEISEFQCEAFVRKPFDIDVLLSHVCSLINGKTGHISTEFPN
jgi:DNA-binding response OmpR family regulator